MKKAGIPVLLLCIIFLILMRSKNTSKDSRDFDLLFQEFFCREITSNTLNLHYTLAYPENFGIKEYPVTFGSLSQEKEAQSAVDAENFIKRLSNISPYKLKEKQKLTYEILWDYLDSQMIDSQLFLYPELLSPSSGIQSQIPILLAEYTFRRKQDIEDYLILIEEVPNYFEEICRYEKLRLKKGLVMADYTLSKVISQCSDLLANKEEHFLHTTFQSRIQSCDFLKAEEKAAYIEKNNRLLSQFFFPAYERLADFSKTLMGKSNRTGGLKDLKNGREYYEYLLQTYTGTKYTAVDVKEKLTEQWKKDYSRLSIAMGDPSSFYAALKKQPETLSPEKALLDLQQKMEKDFPPLPPSSFTIKYVDKALEPYSSPAFYLTPPIDDPLENIIYINKSTSYTGLQHYTTLAHEGYPGHLYQTAFQANSALPPIRNLFSYTGYIEGWALYTEMLSYYYADVDPVFANIEQLNHSLTLCLYSMLDVCIHYDGYTLDETKEFLSTFGKFSDEGVTQLYQYIAEEPANYLKYYIGYLEILRLREKAENALQDKFVLKDFHEFLLSIGPAPFSIIEKWQEMWISHILSFFLYILPLFFVHHWQFFYLLLIYILSSLSFPKLV